MIFGKKKKEAPLTGKEQQENILEQFNMPSVSYHEGFDYLPKQTAEQKLLELDKMDDLQFEFYLCKIFQLKGCTVKFTPVVDDFGADLIVERQGVATAVRCRLVKGGALLGANIIDETLVALKYYPCDDTMIVTNGYFSKEAVRYAAKKKISLVDRNLLIEDFLNYKIPPLPKEPIISE